MNIGAILGILLIGVSLGIAHERKYRMWKFRLRRQIRKCRYKGRRL